MVMILDHCCRGPMFATGLTQMPTVHCRRNFPSWTRSPILLLIHEWKRKRIFGPKNTDSVEARGHSDWFNAPVGLDEPTVTESTTSLDSGLFYISIGFVEPLIVPALTPMSNPLPNIISLPYGRSPPLHLQAPTWPALLKLMARSSGTRIEPTLEALAATRSASMHLRTVVQFVRTDDASTNWRVLLWFTIDHDVPASLPNQEMFIGDNVNVLPWSYTLSRLPALLRDGSDTSLSRFYTIPRSTAVPYPALPVTFPVMAVYLAAALEDSQKYINDSSSNTRKLAQMMEMCYPAAEVDGDKDGWRRFFRKVIGRPGRKNKRDQQKDVGNNEEASW
ncbi:hypothetical protein C8R47DRAFT_130101 [Mycena vitilis]|nr:hypothetical protein C8R47DRAFT_130101 [Mycena vitilis]